VALFVLYLQALEWFFILDVVTVMYIYIYCMSNTFYMFLTTSGRENSEKVRWCTCIKGKG